MSTRASVLRRSTVAVAAVAILCAGAAPVAHAEPVDVSFVLVGGNVSTDPEGGGLDFPADGTFGLAGTWDDETGALDVELVAPQFEYFPEGAPIDVAFIDIENTPMTGSIDPDTGEVELSGTTSMSLDLGGAGVIICTIDNIDLELSSAAPGGSPFDFDTESFAVAQEDLAIEAAECANPAVAGQLNDFLSLPSEDASLSLVFEAGDIEDAPTLEPVTPEPPAGDNGNGDTDDQEPEEIVEIIEIIEPIGAGPRFTG